MSLFSVRCAMTRFPPVILLSLLFPGVALTFALAMGQTRGDWLLAAMVPALGLGLLTAKVVSARE